MSDWVADSPNCYTHVLTRYYVMFMPADAEFSHHYTGFTAKRVAIPGASGCVKEDVMRLTLAAAGMVS